MREAKAAERQRIAKAATTRFETIERKIAAIVTAVDNGRYSPSLGDRLAALESEKTSLRMEMLPAPAPVVRLHPRLADVYAAKVARLADILNDTSIRDEANALLRALIERVELRPGAEGQSMDAMLVGDLAGILALCEEEAADSRKRPAARAGGVPCTSVVAGARTHLYRTRLCIHSNRYSM